MEPRIEQLPEKLLVGIRLRMSLAEGRTPELWRGFMPRRTEVPHRIGTDLISMQVFDPGFDMRGFTPSTPFDKWAAVEVSEAPMLPTGMERFTLPGGLYAVFDYKGPVSDGPKIFGYIFGQWVPASPYALDDRPHFEVLGPKYSNTDPASEEEIWIPIRLR